MTPIDKPVKSLHWPVELTVHSIRTKIILSSPIVADFFLLKCLGLDNLISSAPAALFNYHSFTRIRYISGMAGQWLTCSEAPCDPP